MEYKVITAVGIDVSKGKSMVAVRRPGGEVVMLPFQVIHDAAGLSSLVKALRCVDGDVRIVMEHTGMYWRPIALALKEAGCFVSVVNAILIHDFSDNCLRKVKTDKADSMKIASYALAFWQELREYSAEDETRQLLKTQSRLYERTQSAGVALRNSLIALIDQTFPGANHFFDTTPRKSNGHVKWVDFVKRFWHKDCVAGLSLCAFSSIYHKWCSGNGYRFSASAAENIHRLPEKRLLPFSKTTAQSCSPHSLCARIVLQNPPTSHDHSTCGEWCQKNDWHQEMSGRAARSSCCAGRPRRSVYAHITGFGF